MVLTSQPQPEPPLPKPKAPLQPWALEEFCAKTGFAEDTVGQDAWRFYVEEFLRELGRQHAASRVYYTGGQTKPADLG